MTERTGVFVARICHTYAEHVLLAQVFRSSLEACRWISTQREIADMHYTIDFYHMIQEDVDELFSNST